MRYVTLGPPECSVSCGPWRCGFRKPLLSEDSVGSCVYSALLHISQDSVFYNLWWIEQYLKDWKKRHNDYTEPRRRRKFP
jgi:hypothetical protein